MAYTTINAQVHAPGRTTSALERTVAQLKLWRQRMRDRAELAQLTARDARDLGVDPGAIAYEISKPFWRA